MLLKPIDKVRVKKFAIYWIDLCNKNGSIIMYKKMGYSCSKVKANKFAVRIAKQLNCKVETI